MQNKLTKVFSNIKENEQLLNEVLNEFDRYVI